MHNFFLRGKKKNMSIKLCVFNSQHRDLPQSEGLSTASLPHAGFNPWVLKV